MCDFDAVGMLAKRRQAVNTGTPANAIAVMAEIDEQRWSHFEQTGCDCWERAIVANPYQRPAPEVQKAEEPTNA